MQSKITELIEPFILSAAYMPMIHSTGIPPKIYGLNYVKKGTHKRTNKKK